MYVNGELRQQIKTDGMMYDIYEQTAHLSKVMTLEPEDVLATGTPSGVGIGMRVETRTLATLKTSLFPSPTQRY